MFVICANDASNSPINVKPQGGEGGGNPWEFDTMKLSQGRDFDI